MVNVATVVFVSSHLFPSDWQIAYSRDSAAQVIENLVIAWGIQAFLNLASGSRDWYCFSERNPANGTTSEV